MQKRIFLFLVWIAAAGTSRAELVNLTFDELAPQSADGVSLAGATFGFTVNGTALDEAIYGTTDGPREQEASLMRGARLTGPSAGILTIDFNTPTSILEFSVVVNEILPLFPGFTVELFDGTGEALNITHVDMHPEQFFSQARFTHAGTPVGRVRISFIITGDRAVFGLDNLTFDGAPVATCDVRLSPGERLIPNSGGAGTIGVIAEPGCDWSATTQDPFLTFMGPAGGTASGTLNYTVNAHADALSRTGTIVVNNRQFIVRQAGTTPFSALQPAQLFFRGKQDSAPQSQLVVLFTSSPGHAYTVSPLADFGLSWLTASETQGFSPATFAITADPAGLIAGTYRGTVTVTISTAEPSVLRLPVQMLVEQSGEAELSILPDRLTFHFSPGESGRSTPVHLLNGGGGSLMYESSSTTSSAEPWLSATDGGGTASLSSTGTATISANPAGLPEGTYRGTVEFFSPTTNERVPLPVRMVISGTDPALTVSLRGLSFTGVQGPDTTIPAQRFKLRSTGPGEVNWSVRTSTLSGPENWLQATPASGTTAEEPAEISVIAGQAGLEPGTYYGQVFIESSQAINSPQTITVVLEVLPPGSGPVPVVRPGALVFAGVAGRPIPEAQTLVLANRTPQARTFTIGATSALLSAGLRLDRNSGVLPAGSEVVIQVLPETAGMAAGIVEDFLTVIFDDGNVFPVPVTVILADIGAGSAGDASGTGTVRETGRSGLAGCAPERLWPSFTAPGAQFTVRTGWPVTMEALIVDDCGDPLVSGTVVAAFSNSDPALALRSTGDGFWSGTWQPTSSSSPVTITLTALEASGMEGGAELQGQEEAIAAVPQVGADGVVSAASFEPFTAAAPGGMISIFGLHLADDVFAAQALPLPTELGSTSVWIGEQALPFLFVSPGQINAIAPYGLSVNAEHRLTVQRGNQASVPEIVGFAATLPAGFTNNQQGTGQGAALNQDFSANSAQNPAQRGQVVQIFSSGLGAVNPPVLAAGTAPSSPLSLTVNSVSVTIGGVAAAVPFAGLAPGFAGLYQVNAVVPEGVAPGETVPVRISVGGQTSPPFTIAVQ